MNEKSETAHVGPSAILPLGLESADDKADPSEPRVVTSIGELRPEVIRTPEHELPRLKPPKTATCQRP